MDKPVWSFESSIHLTINQIEKVLFNIKEGVFTHNLPFILSDKTACSIKFNGDRYIISFEDGHREYIDVDKSNHVLRIQGQWWYKGVYSFQQLGNKTLIRLNVFNIAEKFRWAAAIMILPEKQKHQMAFDAFIDRLKTII